MKRKMQGHRRRRKGTGRFFLSALAIAVVIFVVVQFVEYWRTSGDEKAVKNEAPVSVTALMPQPAESLAGFALFMSRCKRSTNCPYYALSASKDTLKYVGVRGVEKRGTVEVALTTERKRRLLELVQKASFFTLDSSYDLASPGCEAEQTDAPTLTVGVTLNGETKVVTANKGCVNVPQRLFALARGIDRVSGSARWTGIAPPLGASGRLMCVGRG